MTFDSVNFLLFCFLVYILYWWSKKQIVKKLILIAASYIFYASYGHAYVWLLLLTTLSSYWYGKRILEVRSNKQRYLYGGLIILLGILGVFKYWNFVAENLSTLGAQIPVLRYLLPVGISFYIFHAISFLGDSVRGKFKIIPSFIDYALYISFFPKLIAGPISQAQEFLTQDGKVGENRRAVFWQAIILIFFGLFKKLVFANNLAPFVDTTFTGYQTASGWTLLLASYAYAVQIYCDFSGYTDIARGVARIFGYRLPINFNYPYLADSPSDFWRRWHISLSNWFKEYVYFPLGGSRRGELLTYRNIFLVMLLTGVWHGASWNFVVWGLYWAVLSVAYKRLSFIGEYLKVMPAKLRRGLSILLMLQLTVAGWIMFRAPSVEAFSLIFSKITRAGWQSWSVIAETNKLVLLLMLVFTGYNLFRLKWELKSWMLARAFNPLVMSLVLVGFLVILIAYPAKSTQFIYFQF